MIDKEVIIKAKQFIGRGSNLALVRDMFKATTDLTPEQKTQFLLLVSLGCMRGSDIFTEIRNWKDDNEQTP